MLHEFMKNTKPLIVGMKPGELQTLKGPYHERISLRCVTDTLRKEKSRKSSHAPKPNRDRQFFIGLLHLGFHLFGDSLRDRNNPALDLIFRKILCCRGFDVSDFARAPRNQTDPR